MSTLLGVRADASPAPRGADLRGNGVSRDVAPSVELRTLRAFLTVAKHRSFTHAAQELFLTQSAVSQQIRALETTLGSPLFVREPHSVELTDAGRTLLPRAREIIALADGARALVERPRSLRGRLRIVGATVASSYLYVGLFELFARAYPEVALETTTARGRDAALTAVRDGDADAGFMQFPVEGDDVAGEELGQTDIIAVAAPGPVPERVLLWDGSPELLRVLHDAGREAAVITNDVSLLKRLVDDGAGVALVPYWAVARELRAGAVVRVDLAVPVVHQRFGLVSRRAPRSAALEAFVDYAIAYRPVIAELCAQDAA